MSNNQSFRSEHLSGEEIDAGYKNALKQVEMARLQARINSDMRPSDSQLSNALRTLEGQLKRLEASYDAWVSSQESGPDSGMAEERRRVALDSGKSRPRVMHELEVEAPPDMLKKGAR